MAYSRTSEVPTRLRAAHPCDAERLTQIALAAKAHWDYPEEWLELWRPELAITAETVQNRWSRVALLEEEPMAVAILNEQSRPSELEHLWVDPKAMGRGLGSLLLEAAVDRCRAVRVNTLKIVSDPNAEAFYQRKGARRVRTIESQPFGRQLPVMHLEVSQVAHGSLES